MAWRAFKLRVIGASDVIYYFSIGDPAGFAVVKIG
jgi:hypothetical protein